MATARRNDQSIFGTTAAPGTRRGRPPARVTWDSALVRTKQNAKYSSRGVRPLPNATKVAPRSRKIVSARVVSYIGKLLVQMTRRKYHGLAFRTLGAFKHVISTSTDNFPATTALPLPHPNPRGGSVAPPPPPAHSTTPIPASRAARRRPRLLPRPFSSSRAGRSGCHQGSVHRGTQGAFVLAYKSLDVP